MQKVSFDATVSAAGFDTGSYKSALADMLSVDASTVTVSILDRRRALGSSRRLQDTLVVRAEVIAQSQIYADAIYNIIVTAHSDGSMEERLGITLAAPIATPTISTAYVFPSPASPPPAPGIPPGPPGTVLVNGTYSAQKVEEEKDDDNSVLIIGIVVGIIGVIMMVFGCILLRMFIARRGTSTVVKAVAVETVSATNATAEKPAVEMAADIEKPSAEMAADDTESKI